MQGVAHTTAASHAAPSMASEGQQSLAPLRSSHLFGGGAASGASAVAASTAPASPLSRTSPEQALASDIPASSTDRDQMQVSFLIFIDGVEDISP
jgi:hypothetical protein